MIHRLHGTYAYPQGLLASLQKALDIMTTITLKDYHELKQLVELSGEIHGHGRFNWEAGRCLFKQVI